MWNMELLRLNGTKTAGFCTGSASDATRALNNSEGMVTAFDVHHRNCSMWADSNATLATATGFRFDEGYGSHFRCDGLCGALRSAQNALFAPSPRTTEALIELYQTYLCSLFLLQAKGKECAFRAD